MSQTMSEEHMESKIGLKIGELIKDIRDLPLSRNPFKVLHKNVLKNQKNIEIQENIENQKNIDNLKTMKIEDQNNENLKNEKRKSEAQTQKNENEEKRMTLNERFVKIHSNLDKNRGPEPRTDTNRDKPSKPEDLRLKIKEENKENFEPMDVQPMSSSGVPIGPIPVPDVIDDKTLRQIGLEFRKRRQQRQQTDDKKIFRSNGGHSRGTNNRYQSNGHNFRTRNGNRYRAKTGYRRNYYKRPVPSRLELDLDLDLYMSGAMEELKRIAAQRIASQKKQNH